MITLKKSTVFSKFNYLDSIVRMIFNQDKCLKSKYLIITKVITYS